MCVCVFIVLYIFHNKTSVFVLLSAERLNFFRFSARLVAHKEEPLLLIFLLCGTFYFIFLCVLVFCGGYVA